MFTDNIRIDTKHIYITDDGVEHNSRIDAELHILKQMFKEKYNGGQRLMSGEYDEQYGFTIYVPDEILIEWLYANKKMVAELLQLKE